MTCWRRISILLTTPRPGWRRYRDLRRQARGSRRGPHACAAVRAPGPRPIAQAPDVTAATPLSKSGSICDAEGSSRVSRARLPHRPCREAAGFAIGHAGSFNTPLLQAPVKLPPPSLQSAGTLAVACVDAHRKQRRKLDRSGSDHPHLPLAPYWPIGEPRHEPDLHRSSGGYRLKHRGRCDGA